MFSFGPKPAKSTPASTSTTTGLASPSLTASSNDLDIDDLDTNTMFGDSAPGLMIFERSVQDHTVPQSTPCPQCQKNDRDSNEVARCHHRSRSHTLCSTQDMVPPVLDATTEILQRTMDLDEVEMIYSPRRLSVMSLNQALGRNNSVSRVSTHTEDEASPRLNHSKSTISFMSFNDMLEAEGVSRRPSLSYSQSSSNIPISPSSRGAPHGLSPPSRAGSFSTRNPLFLRKQSVTTPTLSSLLSLQITEKHFLLSPETSDSEDANVQEPTVFSPLRVERVVTGASGTDGERCSVAELIRRNTSEIYI